MPRAELVAQGGVPGEMHLPSLSQKAFFLGGGLAAEVAKDVNRTVNSRQFLGCQGAVAFMPSSHPQILRVPLPECTAQLPSFISLGCLAKFNWITRNI